MEEKIETQPIFYRIEENENGKYSKDGKRYDLQNCHRTESLETYETGEYTTTTDEEGNEIQIPVTAKRVVINKGWLEFETEEQAIEYFGLEKVEDETNNS
jgi:hypothetical protein